MIYVTGDCHGNFARFEQKHFPEQANMTKDDTVIITGDCGGVWFGDSRDDETLDWLERLPFTLVFVCGNHENYDALARYPVAEWRGGKVHCVRPHVLHLMRGQIFELEGYRFFTMGGAKSHDIEDGILEPDAPDFERRLMTLQRKPRARYRINHISWWAQELPSDEEYDEARQSLDAVGWQVDYIITHCAPQASPSRRPVTTRRIGSRTSCKRYGKEQHTSTGCSAIIMTTKPLTKSTSCSGSRSYRSSEAGQSREKHGDAAVLFSALSVDQAHRTGKEKAHEHPQANRLHRHVCRVGCAYGGAAPADGIVLRDRSSGQPQERKRRGCRGVGIPAIGLSRSRWFLSPQCAPDAGLLPDVRRYAGIAGSGNASELDTECGHHGGRIDHGREVLVHS